MRLLRFIFVFFVPFVVKSTAAEKPSILFIMADDIGYGDLGSYGATLVKTPNLDKLRAGGCKFTDAHSPASTCTPTRRALLTGTYSWRQKEASSIMPGDAPLGIKVGTTTLPSVLKQAGYNTGIVGKWHIGLGPEGGPDWNGEIKPGPNEIGFDYSFIMAATGDRVPTVYLENHRVIGLDPADPIKVSYKNKVGTEPTGSENPELLKLKHTHGHDMTIVNGVGRIGWMTGGKSARWVDEDMADTFAKKAVGFLEKQKAGTPFFLYFATHGIHVPRVPHPRFKGASQCGIRGDAIAELDDTVGQVLAALDRLKLADNTLVVFTSDNGGVNDDGYEDFDTSAHKMNGVLRGQKGTLFEGGHRVPFIARWPGKIKPGSESGALIAHLDMTATAAALTGVKLADDAALDSFNVLPALLGESQTGRPNFIGHSGGVDTPKFVRVGDWVLLPPIKAAAGRGAQAAQGLKMENGGLFNVANDLPQNKNLLPENSAKAEELKALLTTAQKNGRTRP